MPHVPIFAGPGFAGGSGQGIYADVMREIDWSVGTILHELSELGLDEETLVVFASDNGPWLNYGDHAGVTGPLREGKGTNFEGGVRVPCVVRWPRRVPAPVWGSSGRTTPRTAPSRAARTPASTQPMIAACTARMPQPAPDGQRQKRAARISSLLVPRDGGSAGG